MRHACGATPQGEKARCAPAYLTPSQPARHPSVTSVHLSVLPAAGRNPNRRIRTCDAGIGRPISDPNDASAAPQQPFSTLPAPFGELTFPVSGG